MSTQEQIQRVCMYVGEKEQWQGVPLYIAVLELLQREGATGATVLRGLAGFGPGHRLRVAAPGNMRENPPVVIEWIDRGERIAQILPLLDPLLAHALITLEDLHIYRARLRSQGPFAAEQNVSDFMQTTTQGLPPTATLDAALAIVQTGTQMVIPILNDSRQLLGLITAQDLAHRARVQLPLRLFPLLHASEMRTILDALDKRTVGEIMQTDPRHIYQGAAIPQTLAIFIEWNYDQVPVVDHNGIYAGLLGPLDILRAAQFPEGDHEGKIQDAIPPTPVHLIMQTAVGRVLRSESLGSALQQLLATADGYLVVVDAAGRVQGSISDAHTLCMLRGAERSAMLIALQSQKIIPEELPGWNQSFDHLIELDVPSLSPEMSIDQARRIMLEQKQQRLPVVDADGQLLGIISQGGLLRALAQANE